MIEPKHIYINVSLQQGVVVLPKEVAHRLGKVLRLPIGAEVALFNGKDGLWQARLDDPKAGIVSCLAQLRPQPEEVGPTLILACLKRDAFETALRQATEMGVQAIQPVTTDFTVKTDFNLERAFALVIEAAEQCERLTLPEIKPVRPLKQVVAESGTIYWAAERGATGTAPLPDIAVSALVGPEGGFSPAEKDWLGQQPHVVPVSLGKNILRADTAVVAVLSLISLHPSKARVGS